MILILAAVGGAGILAAALAWLATRGAPPSVRVLTVAGVATAAMIGAAALGPSEADAELARAVPVFLQQDGYRSSDTCRSCHPGQYESWHRTFHRTMTQVATPEAVAAPFDGRILAERGRAFAPVQDGERFYVVEVDPARRDPVSTEGRWWEGQPNIWRVVLTTGSHHLQGYWVEAASGRLEQFPFVFFVRDGRWLANSDSFLQPAPPEDEALRRYVWADECAVCHSTGGPWPPEEGRESAAVTELGISCEECHGPAEDHAEANRWPTRRYALHDRDDGDSTIVQPRRLDHVRSSAVCGQCHAIHPEATSGPGLEAFLPGDRLEDFLPMGETFALLARAEGQDDLSSFSESEREDIAAFWEDGTVRVAGREHSGMVRSGCYTNGQMACTSCHSLHAGEPDKQLDPAVAGDAMCSGCHVEIAAAPTAHTHHDAENEGSRCVSCHMPHVSYGLLGATRSHRMDGPTASGASTRARPNACNLCHLDRSLGWAADHLAQWYGQPRPTLPEAHEAHPAGAVWMLGGDAAQRGVVAWHVGDSPSAEASDVSLLLPALALMMEDPYSAVRQIAARAALDRDPRAPIDLDAITRDPSPPLRARLLRRWPTDPALPLDALLAIQRERDDTPTWVSE